MKNLESTVFRPCAFQPLLEKLKKLADVSASVRLGVTPYDQLSQTAEKLVLPVLVFACIDCRVNNALAATA